jgi:hypothetical protein
MIRATARSCETCWFYRELKENFGVCRKNSPKPESIIDPDEEGHGVIAMWPQVMPDDWCGDHLPAIASDE